MSAHDQLKAALARTGVPHKKIDCYGRQIVVTSGCKDTADKWASVLSGFAKVHAVIESLDEASVQRGGCLNRTYVRVWRTYARIPA